MLRFNKAYNDRSKSFAYSTAGDNIITKKYISDLNLGRKRICVKYHNSTTSYGLHTDTSNLNYSPKILYEDSTLYFASITTTTAQGFNSSTAFTHNITEYDYKSPELDLEYHSDNCVSFLFDKSFQVSRSLIYSNYSTTCYLYDTWMTKSQVSGVFASTSRAYTQYTLNSNGIINITGMNCEIFSGAVFFSNNETISNYSPFYLNKSYIMTSRANNTLYALSSNSLNPSNYQYYELGNLLRIGRISTTSIAITDIPNFVSSYTTGYRSSGSYLNESHYIFSSFIVTDTSKYLTYTATVTTCYKSASTLRMTNVYTNIYTTSTAERIPIDLFTIQSIFTIPSNRSYSFNLSVSSEYYSFIYNTSDKSIQGDISKFSGTSYYNSSSGIFGNPFSMYVKTAQYTWNNISYNINYKINYPEAYKFTAFNMDQLVEFISDNRTSIFPARVNSSTSSTYVYISYELLEKNGISSTLSKYSTRLNNTTQYFIPTNYTNEYESVPYIDAYQKSFVDFITNSLATYTTSCTLTFDRTYMDISSYWYSTYSTTKFSILRCTSTIEFTLNAQETYDESNTLSLVLKYLYNNITAFSCIPKYITTVQTRPEVISDNLRNNINV